MSNSEVDLMMVITRSLGDLGFPRKNQRVMGPGPMGLDLDQTLKCQIISIYYSSSPS